MRCMLKTRRIQLEDFKQLRQLHEAYYSEFECPDFNRLANGFVIEDESNEVVIAGGIEPMAEALLISNKTKSRIKLGKALVVAQGACAYACNRLGIRSLHAFVNNPEYARHLIKHGFEERTDQVLRMRIPNG
jgi:hypothetical protein